MAFGAFYAATETVARPGAGSLFMRRAGRPRSQGEGALDAAGVELAGAADFVRVADHFVPVADPADGAREGEDDGEHVRRYADGVEDDAGVEVDVGVEFAFDKVRVFQGDLLEFARDFEDLLVAAASAVEDVAADFFEDLRARVVAFVNSMAKAHEAEGVIGVFGALDVVVDFVDAADLAQHVERGFVGAAVRGAPERGDAGGDASKGVGASGAG